MIFFLKHCIVTFIKLLEFAVVYTALHKTFHLGWILFHLLPNFAISPIVAEGFVSYSLPPPMFFLLLNYKVSIQTLTMLGQLIQVNPKSDLKYSMLIHSLAIIQ